MTESAPVTAAKIVFARPREGRVQLGPSALDSIRHHLQLCPEAPEAGGVLLGRYIAGTTDIIVDAVSEPMPCDRRSRTRFFRHRRGHQLLIQAAWTESNGTCTWLGEWHTHPEADPFPSCVDRLDWRRKLTVDRYDDALLFLIVGVERLRMWEGSRFRTIHPLRLQRYY